MVAWDLFGFLVTGAQRTGSMTCGFWQWLDDDCCRLAFDLSTCLVMESVFLNADSASPGAGALVALCFSRLGSDWVEQY